MRSQTPAAGSPSSPAAARHRAGHGARRIARGRALALTGALALMGALAAAPHSAAAASHKAPRGSSAKSASSLEARHAKCIAFIRDHGLSCDPWRQPTCGYELAIVRPMECVKPWNEPPSPTRRQPAR
jgi:hypothetical protein